MQYTGSKVLKAGLEIQGNFPLDSRTVVKNASDLQNYKTLFTLGGGVQAWYDGMTVLALDTKKLYVLASDQEGFVEVGGSVDPSDLVGVFTYKGTVATYENLPELNLNVGDVYNVEKEFTISKTTGEGEGAVTTSKTYPAGTNVAWTVNGWDPLGGSVDLSNYITNETYQALAGKVSSNESKATEAYNLANATAGALSIGLEGKVDKVEGYSLISDADLRAIAANGQAITTLMAIDAGTRLTALENNIGNTNISTLASNVDTLNQTIVGKADASTVETLSGKFDTLDTAVKANQGAIASLQEADTKFQGNITQLQTTINANGTAIGTLNDNYGTLSGRVDTVETEISTLKSTGIKAIVDGAIDNFAKTVTANDTIDTFAEIVEFVATHKDIATTMATVTANSTAITTLKGDASQEGSVKHSIKTEIDALREEIGDVTSDALEWKIVTDPEEPETTE